MHIGIVEKDGNLMIRFYTMIVDKLSNEMQSRKAYDCGMRISRDESDRLSYHHKRYETKLYEAIIRKIVMTKKPNSRR